MSKSLEQVIADGRADADALARNLDARLAKIIRMILGDVEEAARDYLTFLSEPDAILWSGKSAHYLRARHKDWMDAGHARLKGRVRYYRAIVLPRRAQLVEAMAKANAEGRAGLADGKAA
jgi:class 3 adenylate cyclase